MDRRGQGPVRLAIFGAGGMGRELADIALRKGDSRYREIVFVTDAPAGPVMGLPVIGPAALNPNDEICFALGTSSARREAAARFPGQPLATILSAHCLVSPSASIGPGSVLCDYAMVNNAAVIGRHYQGNSYSQVSHDCVIGDYVTFSPRTTCNGNVQIGDGVFVGAGAVIRNGVPGRPLTIGEGATIGMGAVVVGDVPAGATVIGVPAR